MTLSTLEVTGFVTAWLWPFVRVSAWMAVAPVFSHRTVPARVRIGLAVALSLVLVPVVPAAPVVDPLSAAGAAITAQQVIIGLTLGFALRLVFVVLEVGGQLIAHMMGLGFASLVDPQNGVDVPVVSQLYIILATLVYLGLNGHLMVIEILVDSFHRLPVGPEGIAAGAVGTLGRQVAWVFSAAVLMALPAVTALLTVNLAFGVMSRAAPQLNIFAVGFPVTLSFGFVIMLLSVPSVVAGFEALFERGAEFAGALVLGVP